MAYPKVCLRKIKRKKGISYFIDYRENGLRHRRIVEGNKHTAEQIKNEIQRRLSLGQFDIFKDKPVIIPFELLYNQFLATKKNMIRKSSETRYKNYKDRFATFMLENFKEEYNDISKIKTEYIKECLDDTLEKKKDAEQWSRKTANGMNVYLKSIFNYAVSKKYIRDNPAAGIPKYPTSNKTKVEFYSDKELTTIWNTVNPYWRPYLEFLVHTGLRKDEARNLLWQNVNLDDTNPSITIISRDDWQTKTGHHRTVPLNQRAVEILKAQAVNKKHFVFTNRLGNIISKDDPYQALKKALATLELTGDIHKLRHTFASKLVMAGESLYTVGKLLGHTDPKTTQIYAHLSPDHLRGAVERMMPAKI